MRFVKTWWGLSFFSAFWNSKTIYENKWSRRWQFLTSHNFHSQKIQNTDLVTKIVLVWDSVLIVEVYFAMCVILTNITMVIPVHTHRHFLKIFHLQQYLRVAGCIWPFKFLPIKYAHNITMIMPVHTRRHFLKIFHLQQYLTIVGCKWQFKFLPIKDARNITVVMPVHTRRHFLKFFT